MHYINSKALLQLSRLHYRSDDSLRLWNKTPITYKLHCDASSPPRNSTHTASFTDLNEIVPVLQGTKISLPEWVRGMGPDPWIQIFLFAVVPNTGRKIRGESLHTFVSHRNKHLREQAASQARSQTPNNWNTMHLSLVTDLFLKSIICK